MAQLALRTPPAQWPSVHKKVLVVVRNREDAWAIASEALAKPADIPEVVALVHPGHPAAAPTIEGLLQLAGWSRGDPALPGTHLSVTATRRISQWEPVGPGLAVWPPGYRLLLRRCTTHAPEDKEPHTLECVAESGQKGIARLYCSLNRLEVEDELPPNHTKADVTRWGCRVAWDHMKDVL